MWRATRDESQFSDAEKIAWEFVLPYKYLPLLEEDYDKAHKLSSFLESAFSKRALASAHKRISGEKE